MRLALNQFFYFDEFSAWLLPLREGDLVVKLLLAGVEINLRVDTNLTQDHDQTEDHQSIVLERELLFYVVLDGDVEVLLLLGLKA